MDRISALRNVEDALARFENGECSLSDLEADVRGILRTYATEFDGDLRGFRAEGGQADGIVVLAASRPAARDRISDLVESPGQFTVTPLE